MSARRIATIFDLDGTLVQTEALKAQSYARAAVELRPGSVAAQDMIGAYDEMVGRSREEVAAALLARFGLEPYAERRMRELGAPTPLDAYMELRLRDYEAMIANGELIREQEYPWSTALLRDVKRLGYPVGIATMSHRKHAILVLERLGLEGAADALVTREDVKEAEAVAGDLPAHRPKAGRRAARLLRARGLGARHSRRERGGHVLRRDHERHDARRSPCGGRAAARANRGRSGSPGRCRARGARGSCAGAVRGAR